MYAIQPRIQVSRFGSGASMTRAMNGPLDNDTIRAVAPSIFADDRHVSRSERYTYIPTSTIIDAMRGEGFFPYEVRQSGSRDEEKRGFTKHMVRFRREGERQVGDSIRELILVNSHDGTSSYQLMSGLFRLVCSNGLVVSTGESMEIKVPHKGDVVDRVIEGVYQVISESDAVDGAMDSMRAIELDAGEQHAFARAALTLRYGDEENPPITAGDIMRPRRAGDAGNSLWLAFNRAQENLVKGGVNYTHRSANGRLSRRETRPVRAIDGNIHLNRALWVLADEMRKLRSAA
jgi:hypothetical protein